MAIALAIGTITNSIAALAPTGVEVLDYDEIPEKWDVRKPALFPNPEGFVTDFEVVLQSTGTGGTEKMDVRYTLNYRFCYAPIGSGRGLSQTYSAMTAMAFVIISKMLESDTLTGLVDLRLASAINFGSVTDPAGNMCYGCDMAFRILEFAV